VPATRWFCLHDASKAAACLGRERLHWIKVISAYVGCAQCLTRGAWPSKRTVVRASRFLLLTFFVLAFAGTSLGKTNHEKEKVRSLPEAIADLVNHPLPVYPAEARALHLVGKGNYLLTFDTKSGAVQKALIVHSAGSPILDQAVVDCLRSWKAKPHTLDKVYVPVTFDAAKPGQAASPSNRNILYSPYPAFPGSYKMDFSSTDGTFELEIDQNSGRVTNVRVLDTMGEYPLDIFASHTLRLWRFRPHTLRRFVVKIGF
jgi:TonB family protein